MSARGWVLFALMSVVWGVSYLLIKVAVEGVSVPVLVFARTAVAAAVLLPLAFRGRLAELRRHWRPLIAFAAIEIIVPWALLSEAERHITSSMTGLLIAASPIVAVVLARCTGGTERLSPLRWTGLGIGLAGVVLLAAPEIAGGSLLAIVEVLLVAVCYATAPLIAQRRLQDVPALPMTAACLTFAALVYTPPAIMTWPDAVPSTPVLVALGGLAVICTALAFLAFFALIREVGAARALLFTYVNPAVAIVAGVLVLGEPLTATIVVAFVLILAGCVLATSGGRRPAEAVPSGPVASPGSPAPRAG